MSNTSCPDCGTPTPFTPIYFSEEHVWNYEEGTENAVKYSGIIKAQMPTFFEGRKYAILCCQSCRNIFIALETYGSHWSPVYPVSSKSISKDIPEPMFGEFKEACLCYAVEAYKACAAMCQRVLESICQEKKVSGLNELHVSGIISKTLFDKATEIRLWAGIAKHTPIAEPVSKKDANQLVAYLEVILNDVYVEPKRLAALGKKREGLKKT